MANEISARWAWSDEARVMVRPYRTYAELAERDDDEVGRAWVFARGPALWALFMGAFVSLTAAGRLVWWHLALSALSWAFLPVVQSLWLLVVTHRRGAGPSAARRVDLYFRGYGPWYAWMLVLSGICLFSAHARVAIMVDLGVPVFMSLMLVALLWAVVLTHACLRRGLGLSGRRAFFGTLGFYVGVAGTLVLYYISTNQLLSLFA